MPAETWGLLPKSQVDDETIEEAIARLIAVHEADASAHLGSGESLEAHRAAETIDHVDDSIIAAKVLDAELYLSKLSNKELQIFINWQALDGWSVTGSGSAAVNPGGLNLQSIATASSYALVRGVLNPDIATVDFSKKMIWQVFATTRGEATDAYHEMYFGDYAEGDNTHYAGIRIDDDKVYAIWGTTVDGSAVVSSHELTGVNAETLHVYRIVFDPATPDLKFYVDGVLEYTATADLPDGTPDNAFTFECQTTVDSIRYLGVGQLLFTREL